MQTSAPWDIFCKVVDNYGDIGVCWRLSVDLASRGCAVRLWVDQPQALEWMAAGGCPNVQIFLWDTATVARWSALPAPAVLVEAFGCELPEPVLAALPALQPVWINLEYLSAESYAQRCHGLPSPILAGPAKGQTRHFFYPGFEPGTGGLLREPGLIARRAAFDRTAWLRALDIPATGERLISLFCYEPAALDALLLQLARQSEPARLLVTPGRAQAALATAMSRCTDLGPLRIQQLPYLSQLDYDHLLWACDLNFVRGEDSLVRAIWSDKPFVWQIYPQSDGAHLAKLGAFLDVLRPPDSLRQAFLAWNGVGSAQWPACDLSGWGECAGTLQSHCASQADLVRQLLGFVKKTAKI